MAEYIVMPERNIFPIDPSISIPLAVMAEPLSIALYSVKRSWLKPASKIAVLGVGPIGLCVMAAAGKGGAHKIFVTDKMDYRLEKASDSGADWTGNPDNRDVVTEILSQENSGLDLVYECCGDQQALDQAVQLLKPGGMLVIVGIPEFDRISLEIHEIRRKEIDIINIRRQLDCIPSALHMIKQAHTDFDSIITHKYNWKNAPEAFDTVSKKKHNVIKALLVSE